MEAKIIKLFIFINSFIGKMIDRPCAFIKYNSLLDQFDGDTEKLMAWAKNEAAKEKVLYNESNGKVIQHLNL